MAEEIKETQTPDGGEVKTDEVKDAEKTVSMTQAEFDAIIAKSKNQVRKQFADYDEVKAKAEEADRIAEEARLAKLDEVERAKEEVKAKDDTVASLQAKIDEMEKAQKVKEVNDKFAEVALSVNIPKEFVEDAKTLAKVTDATSVEDIEEIVTNLVKERPFLVKEEVVQREIGGASNAPKPKSEKSDAQLLQEAGDKYRRTQRMEDKIAYVNLKHSLANK
ncbi:hypothetical protein LWL40_27830 (plasmid) [Bacillus thuringiensis]|uniref:hypothetical protein n=1 Tax=Bacillus thuringiensis TaxID=1428 RepID=UPI003D737409